MWTIVQKDYPFYIANANGSKRKPRPTSTRSVCRASGFVQTRLRQATAAPGGLPETRTQVGIGEVESVQQKAGHGLLRDVGLHRLAETTNVKM
jgi:hypothetical protein